jgi:hypothetical protein
MESSGEGTKIGRILKADRKAGWSIERFDPEGVKTPEGEWRLAARLDERIG